MRNLEYFVAVELDLAKLHPDPDVRQQSTWAVELLTPVCKAWLTEMSATVCWTAMQMHGGVGYIEDSGVPQLYRDIRGAAIYEGTNGMQAVDLLGRKLPLEGGAAILGLLDRIEIELSHMDSGNSDVGFVVERTQETLEHVRSATNWIFDNGLERLDDALAGATPFLTLLGLLAGGWMMCRQAEQSCSDDRLRVSSARFYAAHQLAESAALSRRVRHGAAELECLVPSDLRTPIEFDK